jgi:hypothetical protein
VSSESRSPDSMFPKRVSTGPEPTIVDGFRDMRDHAIWYGYIQVQCVLLRNESLFIDDIIDLIVDREELTSTHRRLFMVKR